MPNIPTYAAPSNPAQALQEEQERAAAVPQAHYEESPQNVHKAGILESGGKFFHKNKAGRAILGAFTLGASETGAWKKGETALLGKKYEDAVYHNKYAEDTGGLPANAASSPVNAPTMNDLTSKYKTRMGY